MNGFLYDRERDKKDLHEKVIYSSRGSRNELKLLEQTLANRLIFFLKQSLLRYMILLSGDLPIQIFNDVRQRLSRTLVL